MNVHYEKKATVTVGVTGSTLLLSPIEHVDAGMYQCSVTVGGNKEKVIHSVEVIIAPELESRNINSGFSRLLISLLMVLNIVFLYSF